MKKSSPAEAVKAGQQASQLPTGNIASFMERDILLQTPAGVEVHKVREMPPPIERTLLERLTSPMSPSAAFTDSLSVRQGVRSCRPMAQMSRLLLQVEGQTEQLLARAPLVCYAVAYPTGERRMACEVAEVRWWLLTTTPSLKVAPLTYMVAMPGERVFYSVTFAEDTPPEVRYVHTCCRFWKCRQLCCPAPRF